MNNISEMQLEPLREEEFLRQIKAAALAALDTNEPLAHYVAYWGFVCACQVHGFNDSHPRYWLLKELRGKAQLDDNESLRAFLEDF